MRQYTNFNDVGIDIAALIIHSIKLPDGIDKDRRTDPILCGK